MRREPSLTNAALAAVSIGALLTVAAPMAMQQAGASRQKAGDTSQNSGTASDQQAAKADLNEVQRHPEKYIGKTVAVEGVAADVLGPHLFTIDTPKWFHLWGGMLVVVPEPFAAIVMRDVPVRVVGTVEKVVLAEARRKWSFLSDPKIEVDLFEKPVLVAKEVTTVAPAIVNLRIGPDVPVGTSASDGGAIKDLNQLASATGSNLVGRRVDVTGSVVRIDGNGFWVRAPSGGEVFVLPATKTPVRAGQTAVIQGTVLETPQQNKNASGSGRTNPVYIYADRVEAK